MSATVTSLGTAAPSNVLATITTLANAEVGDYIVVFGGGNLNGSLSFTITDDAGNTYTAKTESATSSSPVQRVNSAVAPVTTRLAAGSTITCNIVSGARGNQTFCAAVVSGVSGLDVSPAPTVSGSSGDTVTWPATGTLAQADEVILAFVMAGTNTASISSMNGFTAVNSVTSAARTGSLQYKVVAATTTSTPSATIAASTSWAAALASLKVAASTGEAGEYGETFTAAMNRLAGTTGLAAQGAAQVWSGTKLDLLGALNAKNGSVGLGLQAVLNELAGTTGLGVDAAARAITA